MSQEIERIELEPSKKLKQEIFDIRKSYSNVFFYGIGFGITTGTMMPLILVVLVPGMIELSEWYYVYSALVTAFFFAATKFLFKPHGK